MKTLLLLLALVAMSIVSCARPRPVPQATTPVVQTVVVPVTVLVPQVVAHEVTVIVTATPASAPSRTLTPTRTPVVAIMPPETTPTTYIDCADAARYVGQHKCVGGVVTRAYQQGNVDYLDFAGCQFRIAAHRYAFHQTIVGCDVQICGMISVTSRRPQILMSTEEQLLVVDETCHLPPVTPTSTSTARPSAVTPEPPVACPSGCCPQPASSCNIKGNIAYLTGERIYHLPNCENYSKTIIDCRFGERWFCTEAEAIASGWRKARNCR